MFVSWFVTFLSNVEARAPSAPKQFVAPPNGGRDATIYRSQLHSDNFAQNRSELCECTRAHSGSATLGFLDYISCKISIWKIVFAIEVNFKYRFEIMHTADHRCAMRTLQSYCRHWPMRPEHSIYVHPFYKCTGFRQMQCLFLVTCACVCTLHMSQARHIHNTTNTVTWRVAFPMCVCVCVFVLCISSQTNNNWSPHSAHIQFSSVMCLRRACSLSRIVTLENL